MSKPVFTYFPAGGRCTGVRVCMYAAFGKEGFVDEYMTFSTFQEEREKFNLDRSSSKLYSGSLPQLTLPSGVVVSQSQAMARWACLAAPVGSRAKALYPVEDADACMLIDELAAITEEILCKSPTDKDEKVKQAKREEYGATGYLNKAMNLIENRLTTLHPEGPFLLGANISMGDLQFLVVTKMMVDGQFDYIPASYLDRFPAVKAHLEAVQADSLFVEAMAAGMK